MRTLIVTASALAAVVGGVAPAVAATPPPTVAGLTVYARYDHTLRVSWQAPQEAYQRGAGVVVRLTRGYTAAASPSSGYAVPFLQVPLSAQARPLTAATPYTFAVWVRSSSGVLSVRRIVTATTLPDVTRPQNLAEVGNDVTVTGTRTVSVHLWFLYLAGRRGVDIDIAGVRVVRNTAPTTSGGTVFFVPGRATSFTDPTPLARGTRYYYWALPRDTSGHYAYTYVETIAATIFHRVGGTYTQNPAGTLHPPFLLADGSQYAPGHTDPNFHYTGAPTFTWYAYVSPGRYTACQDGEDSPPVQYALGCWTPTGVQDWDPNYPTDLNPPPPDSIGAVDARTSDVTGVNLVLNHV